MKHLFIPILLIMSHFVYAQTERQPDGGGEVHTEKTICVTAEERLQINAILEQNVAKLKNQGLLSEVSDRMVVNFDWPLRKITSLDYNSYYAINNFVDQNFSSPILDYNCGARTYNGHLGTDIDTWPFPWMLVNNNAVEVIAAEAGTIIGKFDGNAHDHCACSGNWNAIYVQHSDGSVAWYGHMKSNALTTKTVGQTVSKGEFLGIVASSGCSTQPHLHFEVYKALPYQNSNLIDPFFGGCNFSNTQTWWAAQKPYIEPTLNANLTHNAVPVHGCPTASEAPNLSNSFAVGSTVYFATYYHDQQINHITNLQILKPDNSVWQSWSFTSPSSYTKSWWYWTWTLPSNGPNGTWKWQVTYQGQTYSHDFTVTGALPVALTSFTGHYQDDKSVLLKWETQSEKASDFFNIERSGDDLNFAVIDRVDSYGDTHNSKKYQYTDRSTLSIPAYYRLVSIDNDGSASYSPTILIKPKNTPYSIYPNPTNDILHINGDWESLYAISIFDVNGVLVYSTQEISPEIAVNQLVSGVYQLQLLGKSGLVSSVFIKK